MQRGLFVVAVLGLAAGAAFAQSKTAAVLGGTVTDPTGAVVQGARVAATHQDTGLRRTTTTDHAGEYRFLLLPPGLYDLAADHPGFLAQSTSGVELTVGQSASVDFRLPLATATQTIDVGALVETVETERTQQASTISEQSVRHLPINRRDYLAFALLAPGVADSKALADANSFRVKQTPDSGLSFYGSNGRGNNVSVDGGEANDSGGGVRPTVSQEAVQEFQVNRANYSAEHGAARGGVVNIVTKSGANEWHGSGFAFFRDEALDATDPFALALRGNALERVKPSSNRQQFGATLGGPIRADKTFFFLGYEQLRRRESAAVPVLTDRSIFGPTPAQQAILGRLPESAAAQLRATLTSPASTIAMFERNSGIFPFQSDDYKGIFKLDHAFNQANQFTLRLNATSAFETNPNLAGLVAWSRGYITDNLDLTGLASWSRIFSPATVNEARVQFNYSNPFTGSNDPYGPALEIAGFGFFNRDRFLPSDNTTRRAEMADNLSLFRGAHQIKLGGLLLVRGTRIDSATFMSGRFTFGTLPGGLVSPALASTTITALQSFNLGLAQSYQQGFGDPVVSANHPLYAFYLQDNWKPRTNLTLNFGVRYEVDHRKSPLPTDRNNLAPRLGFAWDPFQDHKTTLRGGYGLFFTPIDFQIDYVVNALGEIDGYRQIAQVLTVLSPADPMARSGPINIFSTLRAQRVIGIPAPQRSITPADLAQFGITVSQRGPRPPFTVLFRNSADYQNPYAQQASFGIEREIAPGASASISYVFVRGAKLTRSRDDNLLPAPVNPRTGIRDWGPSAENPTGLRYFKNPLLFQDNVYESTANSFYHGMMLEAGKRFGRGLSLHANYTFSKAIDEVLDYNSDFQPNDQLNLRAERSLSSFDQRHKFVFYGVLDHGGFLVAPIFRANSGRPFNLLTGFELNNDRHNTTDRPRFAGRNTGRGPGFWTFDLRLGRRFRWAERAGVELVAEFFNLFNQLNYASINNTVGDLPSPFNVQGRHDRTPSDPLGFTAAFDARRVQLGLRFSF